MGDALGGGRRNDTLTETTGADKSYGDSWRRTIDRRLERGQPWGGRQGPD